MRYHTMYTCIYVIYTCISVCTCRYVIYTFIYIYIYIYTRHIYVHIYLYVCVCVCVCARACARVWFISIHKGVTWRRSLTQVVNHIYCMYMLRCICYMHIYGMYVLTYVYVCLHTCRKDDKHVCSHTYMYAYIRICMLTLYAHIRICMLIYV